MSSMGYAVRDDSCATCGRRKEVNPLEKKGVQMLIDGGVEKNTCSLLDSCTHKREVSATNDV